MRTANSRRWCIDLLAVSVGISLLIPTAMAYPRTAEARSVEDRVQRLENMMENRRDLELSAQIQLLHQEVLSLRGQLEESEATVELLQNQQRELYKDVDRRITALSAAGKQAQHSAAGDTYAVATESLSVSVDSPALTASEEEKEYYQQAYNLVMQRDYRGAELQFARYIKEFPNGKHLPNAYYWLGELYLLQQRPDEALTAFNEVVQHHSEHQKVGDSLLKIGYAYDAKGMTEKAKSTYQAVQQRYEGTILARLAESQLARLK